MCARKMLTLVFLSATNYEISWRPKPGVFGELMAIDCVDFIDLCGK